MARDDGIPEVPPLFGAGGAWDDSALVRAYDDSVAEFVRAHATQDGSGGSDGWTDSSQRGVRRGDLMKALQHEAEVNARAHVVDGEGSSSSDSDSDEEEQEFDNVVLEEETTQSSSLRGTKRSRMTLGDVEGEAMSHGTQFSWVNTSNASPRATELSVGSWTAAQQQPESAVRIPPCPPPLPAGVPVELYPVLVQFFYAGWHAGAS